MSEDFTTQSRDPRIVRLVVQTLCMIAGGLILGQIAGALLEQAASPSGTMSDQTAATLKEQTLYVLGVVSGLLVSTRAGK